MEEAAWIKAEWKITENSRRARVYRITAKGRDQLSHEEQRWTAITAAIRQVLKEA
jgi:PadR family transcriptional regulator, regulatory protein PadR